MTGLSFVWISPGTVSTTWLENALAQRLKDIYIQDWIKACGDCSKADNYSLFKANFHFESYLDRLPTCYRIALTKFRTSNHRLPIERGRYANLPKHERLCTICDLNRVGDEFHFLLECPALSDLRHKYLPHHFSHHPDFFKYSKLMSTLNRKSLLTLGKFVTEGSKLFK